MALQRLKEAAEKAKIELSSRHADRDQPALHHRRRLRPEAPDLKLTRAKLEQLVDDLIERTIEPCKKALKDAGVKRPARSTKWCWSAA
jgi:molecular chaperone DnaK